MRMPVVVVTARKKNDVSGQRNENEANDDHEDETSSGSHVTQLIVNMKR